MIFTEAFAQTATPTGAGSVDILMSILPFLLIFVRHVLPDHPAAARRPEAP